MNRDNTLEQQILEEKDILIAYNYVENIIKGRWEEAEPIILNNLYIACLYAIDVVNECWEEDKPFVMKNRMFAYMYARDVIKGNRVYYISHPDFAYEYAKYAIKNKLKFNQYKIYNIKDYEQLYIGCFYE